MNILKEFLLEIILHHKKIYIYIKDVSNGDNIVGQLVRSTFYHAISHRFILSSTNIYILGKKCLSITQYWQLDSEEKI